MPKFSIIIPLYNKEKNIKETILSVLAQTVSDFEIIIVNDGSTDASESIVKTIIDERIKLFTTINKGVSIARNFGAENAQSEYIAFLDGDDYWYPFYLEEQSRLISKYFKESIFCTAQEVCKNNKIFAKNYSIEYNNKNDGVFNFFRASRLDSIIHTSSVILRKRIFKSLGGFNPNIISGQDTDLWIRIGLKYSVVFSKKICVKYNLLENSLFRSTSSISQKIDLTSYEKFENENLDLKIFLDNNRYSLAIQSKLWKDNKNHKLFISKIDLKNINFKQRFLLTCNRPLLILFKKMHKYLNKWFRFSSFS